MLILPKPANIIRAFAKEHISSTKKRWFFCALMSLFGVMHYSEKRRKEMTTLAGQGINPYDLDNIRPDFKGIYPELSFSVLMEGTEKNYLLRAAKLVYASLQFRELLLKGAIKETLYNDPSSNAERYHHLFGRVVCIHKHKSTWKKHIKDVTGSQHITVAVNGKYYALHVLDITGQIFDVLSIYKQLHEIVLHSETITTAVEYGVFTAVVTNYSLSLFNQEKELDESIRSINESLFLLALDKEQMPVDDDHAGKVVHARAYTNRDYRKPMQLIVLGNGRAGVTFNLLGGVEGVIGANFSHWINQYKCPYLQDEVTLDDPISPLFIFHPFTSLKVDGHQKAAHESHQKMQSFFCNVSLIKTIPTIGKEAIKSLGVSPDAFFHVAMHLAYFEQTKSIASVHNFVDMRGSPYGSITRYYATTSEMELFLNHPSKENLLSALDAHKKRIVDIKNGVHPLHYIYFYLLKNKGVRPYLGAFLLKYFIPEFVEKYISPNIWASNIPGLPGITSVGRFGMHFTYAKKNCLAGHYLLFSNHISVCFLANESNFLERWDFVEGLNNAILKIIFLLKNG